MNKKTFYQYRHREINFVKMMEYLKNNHCKDCNIDNPVVLEFDHLPEFEKSFDIGRAVGSSGRSWESIYKEILKCDVVCSNCHKIRTSKRSNDRRYRFWVNEYEFPKEFEKEEETRFRVAHGGGAKGRRGCKCDLCRKRYNEYHKNLRKKIKWVL
jgi:hypothetical protein